ncbi:hypothetical protein M5D96_003387, partial [Drosophila gunungcola]
PPPQLTHVHDKNYLGNRCIHIFGYGVWRVHFLRTGHYSMLLNGSGLPNMFCSPAEYLEN